MIDPVKIVNGLTCVPEADDRDFCYDVETLPNCFLITIKHIRTGERWVYECSDWRNHSVALVAMLNSLRAIGARMVGFNNIGFDYLIIHYALQLFQANGWIDPRLIYEKKNEIFAAQDYNRFAVAVWPSDWFVYQVDLFKIHHFDNRAKTTSLKALEFNMRAPLVEDMPVDHNAPLEPHHVPALTGYNFNDVDETIRFYGHTLPMLKFRAELTAKYGRDFTNFNDTKIGKQFFIMQLEQRGVACFERRNGKKEPRQTWRSSIPLAAVIFPWIQFRHPELNRVLAYLHTVTLTETNSPPELKDLTATIRDFTIYFGAGGGHASVTKAAIFADADWEILDVDVKSYYPNIAIKNRIYPQHLTEIFCDVYSDLYEMRRPLPKKSAESAMLKLSLNGVYGESSEPHGPFYDPVYTMAVTINGQLMLCELAEWLLAHPLVEPVQLNTDGITVRVHRDARAYVDQCCKAWEIHTGLELEYANYSKMFVRDVNNYIAVGTDGKIKRKGDYQHDTSEPNNIAVSRGWNQDHSALVVPKAVEAALVDGVDLATFINGHTDPFDFMLRQRATGQSRLALNDGTPLTQTVRYHIATSGPGLVKTMPQLARKLAEKPDAPAERVFRINVGWSVNVCNRVDRFDWSRLDRRWYIEQAQKLMVP